MKYNVFIGDKKFPFDTEEKAMSFFFAEVEDYGQLTKAQAAIVSTFQSFVSLNPQTPVSMGDGHFILESKGPENGVRLQGQVGKGYVIELLPENSVVAFLGDTSEALAKILDALAAQGKMEQGIANELVAMCDLSSGGFYFEDGTPTSYMESLAEMAGYSIEKKKGEAKVILRQPLNKE